MIKKLTTAFALLLSCVPLQAHASPSLFMSVPETTDPYTQSGNDGFIFTPTTDLIVSALDYYVSPFSLPNVDSLNGSHGVGIYDVTGSHTTALVQTVIGPGSGILVGGPAGYSLFLSQSVSDTLLLAGHQYMLAGYSTANDFENGGSGGGGIPLLSILLSDATLNGYYYDYSGSLDYPTTPYGTAFVGPNFEATPTPEPSTIALIGMALLSLFGIGLMRRRSDA